MNTKQTSNRGFIWMLAGLISVGPLAVDAYLPAMPEIASSLSVSIHQIELTLSVFLVGFALGQLIGGPLSDRYGRRATIISGLSLYILGGLMAGVSDSIELLWIARLLQALGGGLGVVNTMAVIRDLYSGREAAKALSRVVAIMMAAPLFAPFLGSGLLLVSGWRSIFVALAVYGVLLLLMLAWKLPETKREATGPSQNALRRYLEVLKHRPVLGFLAATAFSQASMFAFITGSSLLYMEYYGVSAQLFPVVFGLNILTLIACNRLNVHLLNKFSPLQILSFGQSMQLVTASILLLAFIIVPLPLWVTVALIMLFIGMQGLIIANGMASAAEYFPQSAATTSAVMNASGFMMGALAGGAVGILGDGSPLPLLGVMAASPLIGITLRYLLHRGLTLAE
ncbi:multidrug effflux MFS transporter [Marinospirillum insulare]|uniref:Bcr/CflA family efflux transporter n=1 Tax=Marinospirillum insulare TaxID=217169 RepID=A0ABQ5ZUX3_9GAMM|nr:multidrug effflux MFS transporter [Marinospirillum insulare]GLR62818.1 Bcr/CflA family drug resistance efflux transporter [Marinospirillum insulare]